MNLERLETIRMCARDFFLFSNTCDLFYVIYSEMNFDPLNWNVSVSQSLALLLSFSVCMCLRALDILYNRLLDAWICPFRMYHHTPLNGWKSAVELLLEYENTLSAFCFIYIVNGCCFWCFCCCRFFFHFMCCIHCGVVLAVALYSHFLSVLCYILCLCFEFLFHVSFQFILCLVITKWPNKKVRVNGPYR